MIHTGNPVRRNIAVNTVTRTQGITFFGLDAAKKTVLAIGGSLGAKSINEALAAKIGELENNQLQLIWQTGKTTAAQYKSIAADKKNIWVGDFITQMDMAYAAADIIISRSGSTVYELCVVAKPAVLVPFPYAAEDHQTANAMNLVDKQAAILIPDGEAKEKLLPAVIELSKNEPLQKQLKENIGRLGITDADEVIAREILNRLNG